MDKVYKHLKLVSGDEIFCSVRNKNDTMIYADNPVIAAVESDQLYLYDMLPASDVKISVIPTTSIAFLADISKKHIESYELTVEAIHNPDKHLSNSFNDSITVH